MRLAAEAARFAEQQKVKGIEKEKAVAAEQAWTMAEKAAVEKREQQLAAVSPLPNNGPSSTWRTLCRTSFVVSGATRLRWTVTGMRPLDAQRRTVVPAHAARAPHCGRSGAGFGSILRVEVIKLYQGLVRYELSLRPTLRSYNCGVCRPTAYGAREIRHLAETCLAP